MESWSYGRYFRSHNIVLDLLASCLKLWDILEGTRLFNVIKPKEDDAESVDDYDEHLHLAQITALLGPRSKESASGRRTSMFYQPDGTKLNLKL